jgi:hypothetical protein
MALSKLARIQLIVIMLLLPATAHAGFFGWLFGKQTKTAQAPAAPPGTPSVPALDFYGLSAAIGAMVYVMRRRK